MEARHCLNCHEEVAKRFCPNCGQKSDTHRITLKNFIAHDLLHGLWHIERGMLFTAKEAVIRPGKAALDYIGGKRVRYYNVFYLSLLVIAGILLLNHLYESILDKPAKESSPFDKFFGENIKFILLSVVPFLAFNGWLLFRRLKLNLAEHFVIGGVTLLGMLLCLVPLFFVKFLEEYHGLNLAYLKLIFISMFLFYPAWTYINAASKKYGWLNLSWRVVLHVLLTLFEVLIFLSLLAYLATNDSSLSIEM